MKRIAFHLIDAGYVLVPQDCDLALGFSISKEVSKWPSHYTNETMSLRGRGGVLLDRIRLYEHVDVDDPDRAATIMVNALNRSIATISPNGTPVQPAPAVQSEWRTYVSNNRLLTVRYPSAFTAKTVGRSVIEISRPLQGSEDEDLTFISIFDPISQELQPFTSVLVGAEIPKLTGYVEVWRKDSQCAGDVPGVEIEATWMPPSGITYKRWSCTFLREGHGYSFAYDVPVQRVSTNEAVLKGIVSSVRFLGQ